MRNLVDTVVGFFDPQAGLRRVRARQVLSRSLEGAGQGDRFKHWVTQQSPPSHEASLDILRQRARFLTQNNPYASRALHALVSYLVGRGIQPHALADGGKAKKDEILKAWADAPYCDPQQLKNLYGIQALAVKTLIRDGEVLVRRRWSKDPRLPLPLQLEVLEADYLDTSKDGQATKDGHRLVQGIEFDRQGCRAAYHLFREHPGSRTSFSSYESQRYEAKDIIHLFREDRPGQLRGISWFAPVILRLKDFDDYEDAQLMRQKIASLFVGVYKNLDPNDSLREQGLETGELKPGTFMVAPFGYDMEFSNPPQVEGFGDYAKHQKLTLGIGTEVPYMILSGDYSEANYSNARMAMLNFYKFIEPMQELELIPKLCFPIERWFEEACKFQGIHENCRYSWQPPGRDMIDPEKELATHERKVLNGFGSHASSLRELGLDPFDCYDEQRFLQKYFDDHGLSFPCEPRVGVQKELGAHHAANDKK